MKYDEELIQRFATINYYASKLLKIQQSLIEKMNRNLNHLTEEVYFDLLIKNIGNIFAEISSNVPAIDPDLDKDLYDLYVAYYKRIEEDDNEIWF